MTTLTKELTTATYTADIEKSTLLWTGKKLIGSGHHGAVKLKNGRLHLEDGEIISGEFSIDTATITNTDLSDKSYNDMLVGHLKSEDFFAVEKFPEATFVSKNVVKNAGNNYQITGDLSIKGIVQEITFPATINITGSTLEANATINIDRTKFDIKYGSDSFFSGLGDKVIKNEFTLELHLIANR